MRFVLAIISFVIGLILVGLGVGQRTVFAPSATTVTSTTVRSGAPVTVIPGRTLTANPGYQRITISGSSDAFAAYGRTSDVRAWVADARHTTLRYSEDTGRLRARTTGSARTVPNPSGSDLWLAQHKGSGTFTIRVPSTVSLIITGNGKDAAPEHISVTWPRDQSTPLVGPFLTGGGVFVAGGIVLLIWALMHQHRSRGPRRRSGGGRPPRVRGSRRAAAAGAQVPLSGRRGRRAMVGVPVLVAGALVLSGCSAEYWPHASAGDSATASASASATATTGTVTEPTAATAKQIDRIVARVSAVATIADEKRDSTEAARRFTGPALTLRKANYAIRDKDADEDALPSLKNVKVSVALPQQTSSWPRTVFAVVSDPTNEKSAPQALTLVQESARDPYRVMYDTSLEADSTLPAVASSSVGAAQLAPDVKLLKLRPDAIAKAYADILSKDSASEYNALFSSNNDQLREHLGKAYKDEKSKTLAADDPPAKIAFSSDVPDDATTIALATNGAGAIVSTTFNEIETVTPSSSGDSVHPADGPVKALSGVGSTTKGTKATYGIQVLFSVPPVGSSQKIRVLGFSQGLIAASEVQ